MTKRIMIALAFGGSFRDVLRNSFSTWVRENDSVEFHIVAPSIPSFIRDEFSESNYFFHTVEPYEPTLTERLLRLLQRAVLRKKSTTIKLGNMGSLPRRELVFSPFVWLSQTLFGYERTIGFVQYLYAKFAASDPYSSIFNSIRPDVVVVSRVVNYSADYGVLKSAVKRNVPVIALVSSWDNFTSKGFLAFEASKIVVWNDVMKKQAMDLFALSDDQFVVAGIPRFDNHFRYLQLSDGEREQRRSIFLEKIGNHDRCPVITYCTGTRNWCKNNFTKQSPEPDLVASIYRMLSEALDFEFFFLIRLHPNADRKAYDGLLLNKNVALEEAGTAAEYSDRVFESSEEFRLADTLSFSSVVLHYASTIILDCAMLDASCISINYTTQAIPFRYSPVRLYKFDHYAQLIAMAELKLCQSEKVLVQTIRRLILKNNQEQEACNKRVREKYIQFLDGKSGYRIGLSIDAVIQKNYERDAG